MDIRDVSIKIIEAKKVFCSPQWQWNSINNHWTGLNLWYVFGGSANVKVSNEEYNLVAGDCFIFRMDEPHFCTHNPENPLCVYTVHFHMYDRKGNVFVPALSELPRKKRLRSQVLLEGILQRCVSACENAEFENVLIWFVPFLTEFLKTEEQWDAAGEKLIMDLCDLISREPWKFSNLDHLVKISGYSPNHVIRLFKRHCGMTPYKVCIKSKIEYAKNLILYSDYSIVKIAQILEYQDLSHFSKQFSQVVGVSPRDYQKTRNITD